MLEGVGDYLRRQNSNARLLASVRLTRLIAREIGLTVKVIISDRRLVLECPSQAQAYKLKFAERLLATLIGQIDQELLTKRLVIRVGQETY